MDYDPFHGIEPEPSKHSGEKSKNRVHDDTQGLVIAREFLSLSKQVGLCLKRISFIDCKRVVVPKSIKTFAPTLKNIT